MSVLLIKILEGLFLLGVAGCLVTIPMAGWGYFSVVFEKDAEQPSGTDGGESEGPSQESQPAD